MLAIPIALVVAAAVVYVVEVVSDLRDEQREWELETKYRRPAPGDEHDVGMDPADEE